MWKYVKSVHWIASIRAVFGQSSGSLQAVFGQSLGSLWAVLRQSLGSLQAVFGESSGSLWEVFGRSLGRCVTFRQVLGLIAFSVIINDMFSYSLYFFHIQGCVDHYENCPQWARSGVCTEEPQFMAFLCRESCGTCGFKSRKFFGRCN